MELPISQYRADACSPTWVHRYGKHGGADFLISRFYNRSFFLAAGYARGCVGRQKRGAIIVEGLELGLALKAELQAATAGNVL